MSAVLLGALLGSAQADAELVSNGGFEANAGAWSVPSGWTAGVFAFAATAGDVQLSDAHSGSFVAGFSSVNTLDSLSQSLATVAGQSYTLSFWLNNSFFALNPDGSGGVNQFTASWNGATVFDQTDLSTSGWQQYSVDVTANSADSALSFSGRNKYGYFGLDDVSVVLAVTAVPEPASYAMLLAGLGVLGAAARRRR